MKQAKPVPDDFDFDDFIGVEFLSTMKDRIVGRLMARQQHLTNGERIHGGLIVALAEALAGRGADLNLPPGSATTTIELKTNFMKPGLLGPIFGIAVPLHIGRSTMVWQTSIHDERDRRLAVVQQTQIVFESEQTEAPAEPAFNDVASGDAARIASIADSEKSKTRSTTEQRREQIIAAAFPLISRKGFAQTSVREIAQAVGVSVPAIYKYVSNKDEILELIYQDYISQTETSVAVAVGETRDPEEKLRNALDASMAQLDKHQSKIRLMYRETRSLQPEVRDRVKNQGLQYIDLFQEILEEGIASGAFRNIDTKLVASLIPMLCEVWTLRPWSVDTIGLENVKEGIIDLVLKGIGSDERA